MQLLLELLWQTIASYRWVVDVQDTAAPGHVTGGARASVMKLLLSVVVLLGLEARAQTDKICTAANKDPSHCICNTPNGAIDVTSLGDANGFTKYANTNSTESNELFAGTLLKIMMDILMISTHVMD